MHLPLKSILVGSFVSHLSCSPCSLQLYKEIILGVCFCLFVLLCKIMVAFESTCKEREPGETWVQSLGWEDPLEKGMDTHSSILAWRSGQSHGQRSRVRHN